MRTKLITAVAAAALLAGGNLAFAQGGEPGHQGGAAGATHEKGAMGGGGGAGGHEGGTKGGEKMGQAGGEKASGEKAGGERAGAAEKAGGADKAGAREERKADQGEKGMKADKSDRGDRADRDRGDHGDRADRGDRDRDRADRGDRGRDRADRGDRENVHVNIRVGGAVPEGRRLAPLKTTLIERYPQYRGYQMFTENDEIIIVDPGTRKIVRTVSEGEAGMNHAASTDCR